MSTNQDNSGPREVSDPHDTSAAAAGASDVCPTPGFCQCALPRCPVCSYTRHDAAYLVDHGYCKGAIPADTPPPPVAGTDARETTRELSDTELDAIDARTMAATSGPWFVGEEEDTFDGMSVYSDIKGTSWVPVAKVPVDYDDREEREANAAHIAGLDPQTVRALVAMARRAKP